MRKPAIRDESDVIAALRLERSREMLLLGVLVCGIGCAPAALAEERDRGQQAFDAARDVRLSSVAPRFDVGSRVVLETRVEATAPFAAHAAITPAETSAPIAAQSSAPLATSLWQSINEYRANNRLRLLTLWQTAGSAVSLQAGRHGEPSLQWTSRALNRGGATRGLLDHWVAKSLGAAGLGTGSRSGERSASSTATAIVVRPSHSVLNLTASSHSP